MKSAFDIADRIAYLKAGRIYFEGTPPELQASDDQDIQDFIAGRSRAQVPDDEARIFDRIIMAASSSESSTLEFRVGLFVLVGLAIIGYMVVVLGRFSNGVKPSYALTVELPNASGLLKNSKVLMAGAPGRQRRGRAGPARPCARRGGQLRIVEPTRIARNARVVVGSSGLMGDRFVDVLPAARDEGGYYQPGETSTARAPRAWTI